MENTVLGHFKTNFTLNRKWNNNNTKKLKITGDQFYSDESFQQLPTFSNDFYNSHYNQL